MRTTRIARFWRHMYEAADDDGTKCWEWKGELKRSKWAYGIFYLPGGKKVRAHRLAWEMYNGPIPAGMFVCHKCDNPRCFNPWHLFLGTNKDNVADMGAKGRHRGRFSGATHCLHGHEFNETNTQWVMCRGRRTRQCITCRRASMRRQCARRRMATQLASSP